MADRIVPPSGDREERRPASRPAGGYSDRPQSSRSSGGYSDRPQSSRPAGGYSDRPQSSRSSGGYSDRPQSARSSGGYGDRTQSTRSSGGYGDRTQSTRSASGYGERRSSSRSASSDRPRRVDVIRCENCGEDYSVTYKRCPFCDERPGRGGISGKRVANTRGGGYGRPVNPIQIAGLVVSLALIASALFIVFRFLGAPLFGRDKPGASSSTSQNSGISSSQTPATPTPPAVQSISLNNTDLSLDNGASYQLVANLLPAGAEGTVIWSSSDLTIATVDTNGLVSNLNAGTSDAMVTITAACGDVSAQTSVICKAKPAGSTDGTVTSGTQGRVINADKGLNIRSGPGRNFDVIASAKNGSTVTILGEENGFYRVNYSGDKVGYVSKDYISIR